MSSLIPLLLLTTPIAAQLTTAAWYIGNIDPSPFTLVGSVINVANNLTTIAVREQQASASDHSNTVPQASDTITVGGITYAAFTITAYAHLFEGPRDGPYRTDITNRLACSRTGTEDEASATCEISTVGQSATLAEDCSRYARSEVITSTATVTLPQISALPSVVTDERTMDYRSQGPAYCTENGVPESAYVGTQTFAGGDEKVLDTVALVLTAGLEKLGVEGSAAATTTASGGAASASASASQSSASGSATQSGSVGAAPPARTAAPALVGFGAAAVAFFL